MAIYGTSENKVYDDMGNKKVAASILQKNPEAVLLDRVPEKYEHYVHGVGYVVDTTKKEADEAEATRVAEHYDEYSDLKGLTLTNKEKWVKDILEKTTFDMESKDALGKIFRKLIAKR